MRNKQAAQTATTTWMNDHPRELPYTALAVSRNHIRYCTKLWVAHMTATVAAALLAHAATGSWSISGAVVVLGGILAAGTYQHAVQYSEASIKVSKNWQELKERFVEHQLAQAGIDPKATAWLVEYVTSSMELTVGRPRFGKHRLPATGLSFEQIRKLRNRRDVSLPIELRVVVSRGLYDTTVRAATKAQLSLIMRCKPLRSTISGLLANGYALGARTRDISDLCAGLEASSYAERNTLTARAYGSGEQRGTRGALATASGRSLHASRV